MESACDICGCTQTNLVDGYYYCVECGTQDTNVQETAVEAVALQDGMFAHRAKTRIRQIPSQANKERMTDDWYKWHSLNFLLQGLAGELVDLGAAPSFKTKLFWVWVRYMQKYQNKADFGLAPNEDDEKAEEGEINDEGDENPAMNENYSSFDEDDEEDIERKCRKQERPNIKKINLALVITFIYVALNIDKSHIQLTNLMRFITEERLSLMHWQKFVPKELYPKKLYYCLLFNRHKLKYSYPHILQLAMQLFIELDLGNPIVPDLRLMVDQYMQELSLPNDMKPLVLSLMHYRSYDYLDVNVKFYKKGRIPAYELYVMSHILCAIKICFGVDGEYETEISDAVDKINEIENHPKSYNSEPTRRFFSFREWCSYIQFRKSMLWSNSLYIGAPDYRDMDDYVAFEHLSERPNFKKSLKDEISVDIINKLPDVDVNVIPKSEFPPTTLPYTTYTRVIADYQQDPTIKQLLSEDFTQYSLKYITEDMFLVDPDSINPQNIIKGVNGHMKELSEDFVLAKRFMKKKNNKKMIYVRDCDNHNWMITQRPKLDHVNERQEKKNSETDENENDSSASKETSVINEAIKPHESDSDETVLLEDIQGVNELNRIIEMEIDKTRLDLEDLLKIPEEDENENIFDDNFEGLDTKKEEEPEYNETEEPMPEVPVDSEKNPISEIPTAVFRYNPFNQEYHTGRDSDESSEDSIHLTPETLDRNNAIKELIIHACNKYKVSLPGKYIYRPKRNYVLKNKCINPGRAKVLGLTKKKISSLVDDYNNKLQQDIFIQMSNMVQSAITEFNETRADETPMEVEEPAIDNNNTEDIDGENETELNNTQTLNDTTLASNTEDPAEDSYNLFDEGSDGETHAEELLPKKNEEFNEATHDISQLYVKPSEDTMAPEIILNPNLYKIIDNQIKEENEHKSQIIDNQIEEENEHKSPSPGVKENSDSEEDMTLSMLQELMQLGEQLTMQAQRTKRKKLTPLIDNSIPPYKYWVRHYKMIEHITSLNQRFATELDNAFPASFKILLNECADIAGYPPYYLYKSLQRVERCIKDKYLQNKRFVPSYFEKETKRFRRSKDML